MGAALLVRRGMKRVAPWDWKWGRWSGSRGLPTTNLRATAMSTPAQSTAAVDPFASVFDFVAQHVTRMRDLTTDLPLERLEPQLLVDAREYARRMLQARLDLRAQAERAQPEVPDELDAASAHFRAAQRTQQTVVGDVVVRRVGWRDYRHVTVFPADAALRLPPERYSLTVRRFVAEQVASNSFETAQRFLHGQGIDVPKRQAEQLVTRMARDFVEFYAWHQAPANAIAVPATTLLVLSCDSKGIRMIPEALREDTRKKAEAEADRPRGDPMAGRKERTHDRRMAVVTAVWDQEAKVRAAPAIVDNLRPPEQRQFAPEASQMPRPQNKRVAATITHDLKTAVRWMFDEAHRRDPDHLRPWVVLVDGSDDQREAIEREAARRGVRVTLQMDLLHVLHYLWIAASALHPKDDFAAEDWVRTYVLKVLTRPMADVVAGIRQSATLRGATDKAREAVETCATYLRSNSRYLDYAGALAAGLPIATGVIEGACRHLVQDRMGITGACWDLPVAEAVLRIRALIASGHWDAYVQFHLQRERFRNHSTPFRDDIEEAA